MRILRTYPFLPPKQGGLEKHVVRLTVEQRRLDCEVIIAFNQGGATSSDDIQVIPLFDLSKIKPQVLRDLIFYTFLVLKIVQQRIRVDVVHVHGDWSALFFGKLVASLTKSKKIVGSIHGPARRGLWRFIYRIVLRGYGLIYATGAQDAFYIGSLIEGSVRWQHSGIDQIFLDTAELLDRFYDVVSVGSFVPVKNYELIIEIASDLPNISFLLIGDGPTKAAMESSCKLKRLKNITFAGQVTPEEVAQSLRNAKILLMTSLAEGTPTALLEGMACGLAVITSRSNDYDQLIKPDWNGFVIDGYQAESYVLKIRELLGNENILDEISHRNREQARRFCWPQVAKRITDWMRSDE